MSVIAARNNNDSITIASDSIIIKDDLKRTNFQKVREINGMIIGGCGQVEELSMLFDYASRRAVPYPTTISIRSFLKGFLDFKRGMTESDELQNAYIFVIENKLFESDGMFIKEVTDYTAIGEGEPYALSALHLGHTVEEAVKVACDLCCFVSEPIAKYTVNKNENIKSN